jgi:hypothetical protein
MLLLHLQGRISKDVMGRLEEQLLDILLCEHAVKGIVIRNTILTL